MDEEYSSPLCGSETHPPPLISLITTLNRLESILSSTDMAANTVLEVSVLHTRAKQADVASLARISMPSQCRGWCSGRFHAIGPWQASFDL